MMPFCITGETVSKPFTQKSRYESELLLKIFDETYTQFFVPGLGVCYKTNKYNKLVKQYRLLRRLGSKK